MMKWAYNPSLRSLKSEELNPESLLDIQDACSLNFDLPSIEVAQVQDDRISSNTLTRKREKKKVKRSMTMNMPDMIKTGVRRNSVSLVKSLGVNIDNIR